MLKFPTPTLLALVLGFSGGFASAATTGDRDQQAAAVKRLIDTGFRIPAQRQFDEFKAGGYADDDKWIERTLRYLYLDRFRATMPVDPKDKPKIDAEYKQLQTDVMGALKANRLSPVAKELVGGGGGSLVRQVNEIAKIIHPDAAPPLVELAPEKKTNLAHLAEELCKQMEEDFAAGAGKVAAHKAAEDNIWNLDEKSPEYKKAVDEACNLRIEALHNATLAHVALREVAFRGKDFGIDPKPTQDFLKKFMSDHAKVISQWDFEWGEFTPYIRGSANVLLGEGVKQANPDCKEEDVEGGLLSVANFDTKVARDSRSKEEAYRMKFRAWADLMRLRLELGTPKSYNRAKNLWQDYLDAAKTDPNLKLSSVPKGAAADLGKLYILMARIHKAKGDTNGFGSLLAEVIGAKPANPLAFYAKSWLAFTPNVQGEKNSNPWAAEPAAEDPNKSLLVARAFMQEASATADPLRMRSNYLSAALALRNAVLGLSSGILDDKGYVEFAPQVYQLYAYVLYKLDMRFHCTIAAQEGTRALADYLQTLAQLKKPNPWLKPGSKEWDDSRVNPRKLAFDGFNYSSQLYARDKNTQHLYDESIDLLKRISPDDVGKQLEWTQLALTFQGGEYEDCIRMAQDYLKKYPEDNLRAFNLVCSARTKLIDKWTKSKESDKIANLLKTSDVENEQMNKQVQGELAAGKAGTDRKKELERTLSTILSSKIERLLTDQKYGEAITQLGPEFWTHPPGDDALGARMLRLLGKAANEYNKSATAGDKAKDAAALVVNWKLYNDAYASFKKMLPKYENKNLDADLKAARQYLSSVFVSVANQIVFLQRQPTPPSQMAQIAPWAEESNRAFADLFYPTIDQSTPIANVLFCARKLWDIDQHENSAKLFERYKATLVDDAELQTFKKDGKSLVDKYGAVVSARTEFKKYWDEIADLAWDTPEWRDAYDNLPSDKWPPGQHADYSKCLAKIDEFRAKQLAQSKTILAPEQFKAISEALAGFERLISASANDQLASRRLALSYREAGQFDKALPLLMELYKFDTHDPDAQIAVVNLTRKAMYDNPNVSKDDIKKAREIAASVREAYRGKNKLGFWEAYILVQEFSIGLGENKGVNDNLAFLRRDKSDLSRDLVAPAVVGDDKRVRRAMNAQAVDLCKRFFELYNGKVGISEKPTFRIDDIEVSGKTITIFTDIDAPKFEARTIKTPDDEEVVAIVAVGAPVETPKADAPVEPPKAETPAAPPKAAAPATGNPK